MQYKIFCVREFIKTQSPTAVHRAFRLHFNIQPPTRKSICRWNHQFELIGCLCKGKSSGRQRVSEENVRRIQESFERSPRKSTRRASRELGIPQLTVLRVLRRRLLFNWVHLYESPCILKYSLLLKHIAVKPQTLNLRLLASDWWHTWKLHSREFYVFLPNDCAMFW